MISSRLVVLAMRMCVNGMQMKGAPAFKPKCRMMQEIKGVWCRVVSVRELFGRVGSRDAFDKMPATELDARRFGRRSDLDKFVTASPSSRGIAVWTMVCSCSRGFLALFKVLGRLIGKRIVFWS